MHPVEHDLRGPVPPGGHVARHLILSGPRQPEVEDLQLTVLIHSNVRGLEVPAKRSRYRGIKYAEASKLRKLSFCKHREAQLLIYPTKV